jgi:hypothetical protein
MAGRLFVLLFGTSLALFCWSAPAAAFFHAGPHGRGLPRGSVDQGLPRRGRTFARSLFKSNFIDQKTEASRYLAKLALDPRQQDERHQSCDHSAHPIGERRDIEFDAWLTGREKQPIKIINN